MCSKGTGHIMEKGIAIPGVKLDNGGILRVVVSHSVVDNLPPGLDVQNVDKPYISISPTSEKYN
jgi:hypothetical protein